MASKTIYSRNEHQKRFVSLVESLSPAHSYWQVWTDFVQMQAACISNAVDPEHAERREELYMTLAKKYSGEELNVFCEMAGEFLMAMQENPEQDFLGETFMMLQLGQGHVGQFFTPYHVSQCMNAMVDIESDLLHAPWVTTVDPACGAGALLVGRANDLRKRGINYQQRVLFIGQDVDTIAALMCYLQISAIGCPGYVVIGDSLGEPLTSWDGNGLFPADNGNVWYTPMFFESTWTGRRLIAMAKGGPRGAGAE